MSKLEQQYKATLTTYKDMELEIPVDLETVRAKLTKAQKDAISKDRGQLVISPAITEDFTLYDLVNAFDKQQMYGSYIWKELWDQYDFTQPASIVIAINELQGTNKT